MDRSLFANTPKKRTHNGNIRIVQMANGRHHPLVVARTKAKRPKLLPSAEIAADGENNAQAINSSRVSDCQTKRSKGGRMVLGYTVRWMEGDCQRFENVAYKIKKTKHIKTWIRMCEMVKRGGKVEIFLQTREC
jgi:hypothetical protein